MKGGSILEEKLLLAFVNGCCSLRKSQDKKDDIFRESPKMRGVERVRCKTLWRVEGQGGGTSVPGICVYHV